ncbi:MAG: hypothetical protein WBM41_00100 [Arenicellales bacterium]
MKQIAGVAVFLTRLLVTSVVALCCQILLVVQYPDYLLVIQESVKLGSSMVFETIKLASSYRVAYNLLNGDGIVVHTIFVLLAFTVLYIMFLLFRMMRRK